MKKIAVATSIIVALSLAACGPTITFNQPQPEGVNPLTSFPERLQGKYEDTSQFSVITIADKLMTRFYDYNLKISKDSLDSSLQLLGDTLVDLTDGRKEKITLKGDTIIYRETWIDTLFRISDNNVLKKFKGYYFLNSRYKDTAWEVKKLGLKKGTLTIGEIAGEDDIQKLKEIIENNEDTTSANFDPTKKEFRKFVRKDAFSREEAFTRLRRAQ